jgi:hypothetical protein
LKRAANGDAAAVGQVDALGWKVTADEWNYYRLAGGGGATTVDLFPVDNRGALMSAAAYLARREGAGLGFARW